VSGHALALLIACVGISATGFYIMAGPRHLFTHADDPPAYRPHKVEYDSAQGERIRRIAPFYAFGPPVILLGYWLAGGFRG
jgi:hypothetical protein